jgi:hypothetical protein
VLTSAPLDEEERFGGVYDIFNNLREKNDLQNLISLLIRILNFASYILAYF